MAATRRRHIGCREDPSSRGALIGLIHACRPLFWVVTQSHHSRTITRRERPLSPVQLVRGDLRSVNPAL